METLKPAPACDCIAVIGPKLAERNTRIVMTLCWPLGDRPPYMRPTIATEKIETRKRYGAVHVVPAFCPFCGAKYELSPEGGADG